MGALHHRHAAGVPVDRRPGALGANRPSSSQRLQASWRARRAAATRCDHRRACHVQHINKWAAGIADTLALGLVCEGIGMGLPIVVLPYLNAAQAEHPAFLQSIERLRASGVRVLFGPSVLPLHQPRQGNKDAFPWHLTLAALGAAATPGR